MTKNRQQAPSYLDDTTAALDYLSGCTGLVNLAQAHPFSKLHLVFGLHQ